jgi:hypothetical protein
MTFDAGLYELMPDEVTIDPFVRQDADLKPTFGSELVFDAGVVDSGVFDAATPVQVLPAQVELHEKRYMDAEGREFQSSVRVLLAERLTIDMRSRVTLPAGFVPRQPPLRSVASYGGLGLDHTVLIFGTGGPFGAGQ